MFRAFFLSRQWIKWSWGVLFVLIAMTVLQTYFSVVINEWQRYIYNAMQKHDYKAFLGSFQFSLFKYTFTFPSFSLTPSPDWINMKVTGLWGISMLVIPVIFVAAFSIFIARHYMFRWRQAITFYYLPYYEKLNSDHYEGSSQRIQQDTQMLAQLMYSLGLGGLQSLMTLIAFFPILWALGQHITLWGMNIPGLLVWVGIVASLGGLLMTMWVARKLPRLEYNNQKVEAAYRKQLVFAEDDKTFANQATLKELFSGLRKNYFALFSQYKYFSLWQSFYVNAVNFLPFFIIAPNYFSKAITLGIFMQIVSAFGNVQGAFSFFLTNWDSIVELRSVLRRLSEFEISLQLKHNRVC